MNSPCLYEAPVIRFVEVVDEEQLRPPLVAAPRHLGLHQRRPQRAVVAMRPPRRRQTQHEQVQRCYPIKGDKIDFTTTRILY